MDLVAFRTKVQTALAAAVECTVHPYLPDAPKAPCGWLGRPTVSGTSTVLAAEVSIPVTFLAVGATRAAQAQLDGFVTDAWSGLIAAGLRPESAVPTVESFTDDGPDLPAVVLTITGYA